MRVELFNVEIPADCSRFFHHIPAYEVSILEAIATGFEEVRAKATEESPSGLIVKTAMLIEERDAAAEWARLNEAYPPTMLSPDMQTPILRSVYPSQQAFNAAFKAGEYRPAMPPHAVLRGMAEAAAAEADASPVQADDENEQEPSDVAKPKNKGGRPRKTAPVQADDEATHG